MRYINPRFTYLLIFIPCSTVVYHGNTMVFFEQGCNIWQGISGYFSGKVAMNKVASASLKAMGYHGGGSRFRAAQFRAAQFRAAHFSAGLVVATRFLE